jgi:hypothetical protein
MGQYFSKDSDIYSSDIKEAFEERFIKQKCVLDPYKYISLYVFAYELAFFFRNDPIQVVIEKKIEKLSRRLVQTPDDWLTFTLNFIYHLVEEKRFIKYGHPQYPVILGIDFQVK